MTVRLMLVDDSALLRKGLRLLMRSQPDFDIVGEAENGIAAVELSRALSPDVILMDIRMPGLNGVSATARILAERPTARVVIFSSYPTPQLKQEALGAGAFACLEKSVPTDDLFATIRSAAVA
jgi:DNA-binding NarL/FixJ family response regulator